MRILYSIILISFISIFTTSCGGGGNSENNGDDVKINEKLTLSADKDAIIADNSSSIVFTVKDEKDVDVTSSCSFKYNGLDGASVFKTNVAGTYEVVAYKGDVVSNKITVVATDMTSSNYILSSNVASVVADGGDFITLKLTDDKGLDVSSLATFYDNGVAISGRFFRTKSEGTHTITASIGATKVSSTVTINGVDTKSVKYYLLAEDYTCQSCQYCPDVVTHLKPVLSGNKGDQIIVVAIHTNALGEDHFVLKDGETLADIFDVDGYPYLTAGRGTTGSFYGNETALTDKILSEGKVAIAINTKIEDGKVMVETYTGNVSTTPYSNLYVSVMLVEDKLIDFQIHHSIGRVSDYEHNGVLRGISPSVSSSPLKLGEPITSLNKGDVYKYSTSFSLNDVKNQDNCSIVVAVGSQSLKATRAAKKVKVGDNISY